MNDLNDLNWTNNPSRQKTSNYTSAFTTLKPTPPGSGRVSPLPTSTLPHPPTKTSTPANDSFSGLVSFSSNSSNKTLSLQEQQKRLVDLKSQQAATARKTLQDQYAGADDSFWNNLGSRSTTPQTQSNGISGPAADEDDFLGGFNRPTKQTSHAPVVPKAHPQVEVKNNTFEDDDDPFGLSEFHARRTIGTAKQATAPIKDTGDDGDDVLGLLGRPVSEIPPPMRQKLAEPEPSGVHPQDKAVAELVDMGFPAEKARTALEATESGVDVQAAVGWLLNQAHTEARDKSRGRNEGRREDERHSGSRPREDPATMRREQRSGTPSNDPAKMASELGTSFMKSAGSFWKQAQKKAQQAMQDFNSDSDTSQPKWMREPKAETQTPRQKLDESSQSRKPPSSRQQQQVDVTDEAMMLETARPEKPPRPSQRQRQRPDAMFDSSADNSRDHSPAFPSRLRDAHSPQPTIPRARPQPPPQPQPQAPSSSRTALSRHAAEEQASQAYVSSARRRKPNGAVAPVNQTNLLDPSTMPVAPVSTTTRITQPVKSEPIAVRPPPPTRNIPQISAISLKASHSDREAGNEHFKRGDYSSAHQSYNKSLSHLPKSHPITIILLTNRALTALKIGEPKSAIIDSDAAIGLIGPSKGEAESVDLSNGDAAKPMRDYYGKALMRKAEALEQMEKWAEAAVVWREAVEGGHGGSTSIQGKARAEKAANPAAAKPKPAAVRKAPVARPRAVPSSVGAAAEAAAVSRLRAQNAAADKADDERFALADSVDARISGWKGGKQDNLRALLGSLDTVLWSEAGWKKISMADLVLPNKVKIQYMKAIAKVHPDKISTNATTEQRMIAGAVFSTLNEAWDKFKKENGL